MEIKVNDYVRTKDGVIGKIERKNYMGYNDWLIDTLYYNFDEIIDDWTCGIKEYDIIKTSPRIIDLIEVGDYVNGKKVIEISESGKVLFYQDFDIVKSIENNSIKSVLTKEMFEQMEYKLEKE